MYCLGIPKKEIVYLWMPNPQVDTEEEAIKIASVYTEKHNTEVYVVKVMKLIKPEIVPTSLIKEEDVAKAAKTIAEHMDKQILEDMYKSKELKPESIKEEGLEFTW